MGDVCSKEKQIFQCDDLKKITITPFSLQYLALGAVLKKNLDVDDNKNELQNEENKHLFETHSFKNFLQNAKYNTELDEKCTNIINEGQTVEFKNYWIRVKSGDYIYRYLSENKKEIRKSDPDIITIRPWCNECRFFLVHCVEGTLECEEFQRTEYAHYSDCQSEK